jgi:hypothetical protein
MSRRERQTLSQQRLLLVPTKARHARFFVAAAGAAAVTEAEWLECNDPTPMLAFLQGKASDRKLRLFASACERRSIFGSYAEVNSIVVVERYADGLATEDELRGLVNPWDFEGEEDNGWYRLSLPEPFQTNSASQIAREVAASAGHSATTYHAVSAARDKMANVLASVLRCIFNPFRPIALDSIILHWNNATIPKIAQVIYDNRRFADMPILADALEEAGCTNADIINHCRQPGEHVKGCWVLDLVLGKK